MPLHLDDANITIPGPDGKDRTYDLSDPEQFKKFNELASKGLGYEAGQTKLKSVEEELNQAKQQRDKALEGLNFWNGLIKQAESDPAARETLKAEFRRLGVEFDETPGTQTFGEASDELVAKLQQELKTTKDTLKQYDEKFNVLETSLYSQLVDSEHARLEGMYNEKNGYPPYDRQAVEEFANKNGIHNYKTAYLEMNSEKIIDMRSQKAVQEKENILRKRYGMRSEPGPGEMPPAKKKIYKSYSDATKAMMEAISKGEAPPLTDD